jgi:hypothetical protein
MQRLSDPRISVRMAIRDAQDPRVLDKSVELFSEVDATMVALLQKSHDIDLH